MYECGKNKKNSKFKVMISNHLQYNKQDFIC